MVLCSCGEELGESARMGSKYVCAACGALVAADGSDAATYKRKGREGPVPSPHGRAPQPDAPLIRGRTYIRSALVVTVGTIALVFLFGSESSIAAVEATVSLIAAAFMLVLGLCVSGCAAVAKEKGYSPLWGLLGVGLFLGYGVVLLFPKLPDDA